MSLRVRRTRRMVCVGGGYGEGWVSDCVCTCDVVKSGMSWGMCSSRRIAESDVTRGDCTLALTEIWLRPLMIWGETCVGWGC